MRDLYIVVGAAVLAIAVGSLIYFSTPTDTATSPTALPQAVAEQEQPAANQGVSSAAAAAASLSGTPVKFTVLKKGTDAPAGLDRVNYRVHDATQLATLWQMLYGDQTNPPKVDFEKNEVLAVFDGTHPTGGYAVSITQIADGDVRTVAVTHVAPGKGCMTSEALTMPYEIVTVPKTALKLSHQDVASTTACSVGVR